MTHHNHNQVHPHSSTASPINANLPRVDSQLSCATSCPTVLTVWKKSLLFNGDGFTVFDSSGNIVFRVDNYASNAKRGVLLMDRAGNVLLTLRRKRLCVHTRWDAFRGDMLGDLIKPVFTVKMPSFAYRSHAKVSCRHHFITPYDDYRIEGSFCNSFTVYSASRSIIAQVKRKETASKIMLGDDVFSVVVQPGTDEAFVMGMLIIFNQMNPR